MKKTLFIVCLLFLAEALNAQCDSTFFSNTATLINDVSVMSANKFIAVGDNGYIIKSTDGGTTWQNKPIFSSAILKSIQMLHSGVGYATGSSKTILKTEDEGNNWFPLVATTIPGYGNNNSAFNELFFFNEMKGFAAGEGGIYSSTTDGGRTWKSSFEGTTSNLHSITFITDSLGFMCGSASTLFKTTTGGRLWEAITIPVIGGFETLKKVRFIDNNTGFIVGYSGLCLKTTDGGISWFKVNIPNGGDLYDLYFLNASTGFIVGNYLSGIIYQTSDGGNSWSKLLNVPANPSSFYCINADPFNELLIIGGGGNFSEFYGYNGRTLLSTKNAGTSFNTLSGNGRLKYNTVNFIGNAEGFIAGEQGYSFKTNDHGESWKPMQRLPSSSEIKNIQFTDALHGFASAENLYKTTNGGQGWVKIQNPENLVQYSPANMYFFDSLTGIVQNNQFIYKTTNGGNSWLPVTTGNAFYSDISFAPNGKGVAVAQGGYMDVSNNQGTTWSHYYLNSTKDLTCAYFFNNNIGFIGTANNAIYKTDNGGITWAEITTGIGDFGITSFKFVTELNGYLICNLGSFKHIYKTKDGGLSWYFLQETTAHSKFGGDKTPFLVGESGLIQKLDSLVKPVMPGYIIGPDTVCLDTKAIYMTAPMKGVNYNWSISGGGINSFKDNLDTVFWNTAGFHTVSLTVSNACGASNTRQYYTNVINFQPAISINDSILLAPAGKTYRWYRDGNYITNAEGGDKRSFIGKVSGEYRVEIKSNYGCTAFSAPVNYLAVLSKPVCPGGNLVITSNITGTTYQWQENKGSGYVNISNNNVYSGTNTSTLQLTAIPSSWYGYRYRCVVNGITNNETSVLIFNNTWKGNISMDWENPANWSCGKLPDAHTDVYITGSTVNLNSDIIIRKLVLSQDALVTIKAGNKLTITH